MIKVAKGQYTVESWTEEAYGQLTVPQKSTLAKVRFVTEGSLTGSMEAMLVMYYTDDENSVFNGMQHFNGQLDGKSGSFMLIVEGEYKNKTVSCQWRIVDNSGTEELIGIQGSGGYTCGHSQVVDYELNYEL